MISVPNHRLRLSGSRLLFVLSSLIFFVGCGIFSGGSGKKSGSTDTAEEIEKEEVPVVDTVEWTVVPENEVPPILVRETGPSSQFKDTYKVVIVAPFDAEDMQFQSDRLNPRMIRMIEFYIGFRYALLNLVEDVNIELSTVDTEDYINFEREFMDIPVLSEADIIIGPYHTNHVKALANYALEEQKVLISPWNTTQIDLQNPFYVRLRPDLKMHASVLTEYARTLFDVEELLLLTRNNPRDKETLTHFQDVNSELEKPGPVKEIRELLIDDIGDPELSEHLTTIISEDSLKSVILPVWYDEPFIIAALAKLNFAKADQELTVFGLPQWMDLQKMDYDYYESLHVHVSSAKPISFTSRVDKALQRYYFDTYGDIPSSEIYYGKDIAVWVSDLLRHAGTIISEGFSLPAPPNMSHQFEMVSVLGDEEEIIYHENRHVDVLKFEDYHFQAVDK